MSRTRGKNSKILAHQLQAAVHFLRCHSASMVVTKLVGQLHAKRKHCWVSLDLSNSFTFQKDAENKSHGYSTEELEIFPPIPSSLSKQQTLSLVVLILRSRIYITQSQISVHLINLRRV